MEMNDKMGPKGKGKEESVNHETPGVFSRMKKTLSEGLMVLAVAGAASAAVVACSSDNSNQIPAADAGVCQTDGGDGRACPTSDAGTVADAGKDADAGDSMKDAAPDNDGGVASDAASSSDGNTVSRPMGAQMSTAERSQTLEMT